MKCVAICSGGLDSTVMYWFLKSQGQDVVPVNFHYGSRHNNIERRRAIENIPGLKLVDIDLSFLHSSLLVGGEAVPHGHYEAENMKSTVVPFRNGILLSYAIAIAEDLKIERVMIGSHSGDHAIYPDCRPEFTHAMNSTAMVGTYNHVEVVSPFNYISKADIAKIGRDLGIVPIMMRSWTCYEGSELLEMHCGKCGACTERKEAFILAGIEDTTKYKE